MTPRTTRLARAALALAVASSTVAACGGDDDAGGDGRIEVVASFYPLAELATRVGSDLVDVRNLTAPGVEPHDVELTPDQVDDLEDADLVLFVGDGFQPAVSDVVDRRDAPSTDVLAVVDVPAGDDDPHFWLDPTLLAEAAGAVAGELASVAPEHAEAFRDNAAAYEAELRALDAELATGLDDCERRVIVTAHRAFGHLARRYDLDELAITGLSPEAEPDADRFAELADEIEDAGVTTVFHEELVSPRVADALAREAGVDTDVLNPIEGLTREQLDAGDDYAVLMRDNLAALRRALGCR